jgi:hypothetical protein
MAEPGVELVHRFGESYLELARLGAQDRRHPRTRPDQYPEKRAKDYRDANGAGDSSFLEPVGALSEGKSEQNSQEEKEEYRVGDPDKTDQDVEAEND